jgi:hypothetical protein
METKNSQVVALVVGLLKAARSNATFQKILDESPHLNELLDPLLGKHGAGQPGSLLPDAARPLQGNRSVPQSHDRAARGPTPSGH